MYYVVREIIRTRDSFVGKVATFKRHFGRCTMTFQHISYKPIFVRAPLDEGAINNWHEDKYTERVINESLCKLEIRRPPPLP